MSRENLRWFLSYHRKTVICRDFALKPAERHQIPLKSGTMDFLKSSPFKRSVYLYVTFTRDFECFQYSNLEANFLRNENFSQKWSTFFQSKVLRLERQYFHTKLPRQESTLSRIKWEVQNGRSFATILFFNMSIRASYKQLI